MYRGKIVEIGPPTKSRAGHSTPTLGSLLESKRQK